MDDFRDEVKKGLGIITVGDVKAESEVYESLNITVGDIVEINDTAYATILKDMLQLL